MRRRLQLKSKIPTKETLINDTASFVCQLCEEKFIDRAKYNSHTEGIDFFIKTLCRFFNVGKVDS